MKTSDIQKLSLIVPTYRQEKTIVKNIKKLQEVLEKTGLNYEIIVIVDGKLDKSYEKVNRMKSDKITAYEYEENQGKGFAIKYGGTKATGDVIGFMDAGLDIDPNGIGMLINHFLWYDADIIVGSKMHPVSKVNYPLYRKFLSWGYRTFTRILFGFKVRDTQAGIKLYRSEVVKDVFPRLLVKHFAFDVEILALSYALGYKRIYEAPIKLKFRGGNSITSSTMWKTIYLMIWDTLAVFYRVRIIKYYRKSNKSNWISNK